MTSEQKSRASAKTRQGVVLRNKMDKTVVVEVTRRVRHATYGKYVKRQKRYTAHDGQNVCGVGDLVLLEETRPLSKTKRWLVKEILQKAAM